MGDLVDSPFSPSFGRAGRRRESTACGDVGHSVCAEPAAKVGTKTYRKRLESAGESLSGAREASIFGADAREQGVSECRALSDSRCFDIKSYSGDLMYSVLPLHVEGVVFLCMFLVCGFTVLRPQSST